MTRLYLYCDQPILAKGVETILHETGQFELKGWYSGITELMEYLDTAPPGIVLLDLTPELTFGVLSDIQRAAGESKLVLWVNAISTELAFQAMGLGVRGILRKTLPADLQVKCLAKVQQGELWFEKALTDSFMAARRVVLSQREGQLIALLTQGLKNKEIASLLRISEGTVKVYLSRLFQKVGVKDRLELALFGLKNLTAGQAQASAKPGPLHDAPIPNLRSLVLARPLVRAAVAGPGPALASARRH